MFRPRILIFLLLVVGVGLVGRGSARAQGQQAWQAEQGAVAPAHPLETAHSGEIERTLYAVITRWRYRYFIEYVGREDAGITKDKRGDSQGIPRTDYESALGIGDGEEQAFLEIVINASSKMIELYDQADARTLELLDDRSRIEQIEDDSILRALGDQQARIVKETRTNLMREIGAGGLKRLDAYVFRDFINREGPFRRRDDPTEFEAERAPGSDVLVKAMTRRRYAFAEFFQAAGCIRQRAGRPPSDDKDADRSLPASTPEKDRKVVREIVRKTGDQIQLANAREDAEIGRYHRNSGPGPIPYPLPRELQAERGVFWEVVDSGIDEVKRQLGAEEFVKFDHEVEEVFGPGLWREAKSGTEVAGANH